MQRGGRLKAEALVQIDSLLKAVASSRQSLLMLDYDGTLAPFRKNREQAFPYAGISSVLQEILRTTNTRVVIISGRDAQEVVALLALEPRPEVWGLHGLQRLGKIGRPDLLPIGKDVADALETARDWLRYQHLEDSAEFKAGSIALHWRGLSEPEVEAIRARTLLGWWPIAKRTGLDLLEFDGGVEIRTPGANKGDAVRVVMDEMKPNTPAVYLGDDLTDEAAFLAVNGRGLSILARPQWRSTAAQLWLRPPEEVLDFFGRWLRACRDQDFCNRRPALVNA